MDPKGPDYEAVPLRCHACETRDIAAKKFREDDGDPEGLMFAVLQVED